MKRGNGAKHILIGALIPLVAIGLIVGGGFSIYYFGGDATASNTPGIGIEKMHGADTASLAEISFTDDYLDAPITNPMLMVGQSLVDFPAKAITTIDYEDGSEDFVYYVDVKIELIGVFATYFTIDNTLVSYSNTAPFSYSSDYTSATGTFAKIYGDATTSSSSVELSIIGFSYRAGKMPQSNEQYAEVKKAIDGAEKGENNQIKFTFTLRAEINK